MYRSLPIAMGNKHCHKWEMNKRMNKLSSSLKNIGQRRNLRSRGVIKRQTSPCKTDYLENEKINEIERRNKLLYNKIIKIIQRSERKGNRMRRQSLNFVERKKEILSIIQSNQTMQRRIKNKKSVFNRQSWKQDYEKNHKYCRQIISFPYVLNESQRTKAPFYYPNGKKPAYITGRSGERSPFSKTQKLYTLPHSNQQTSYGNTVSKKAFNDYLKNAKEEFEDGRPQTISIEHQNGLQVTKTQNLRKTTHGTKYGKSSFRKTKKFSKKKLLKKKKKNINQNQKRFMKNAKVLYQKERQMDKQIYLIQFLHQKGSYWITAENKQNPQVKIIELEEKHGENLIEAYNRNFDKIVDLLDIANDKLIFKALPIDPSPTLKKKKPKNLKPLIKQRRVTEESPKYSIPSSGKVVDQVGPPEQTQPYEKSFTQEGLLKQITEKQD